jgi:hypothetical protein
VSVDTFHGQPTPASVREYLNDLVDLLHFATHSCRRLRYSEPCPPSPCPPRYGRRWATTGTPSP